MRIPYEWNVTDEPEVGPVSVNTLDGWEVQDVYPMPRYRLPWTGDEIPRGEVPGWFTVVWVREVAAWSDYQDRMIEELNDAAEAKGVEPIPTPEQIDQLRKAKKEGA